MPAVAQHTEDILAGISAGDMEKIGFALELRGDLREESGLDGRTFALTKIAALIAVDAPPASYAWQVRSSGAGNLAHGRAPAQTD